MSAGREGAARTGGHGGAPGLRAENQQVTVPPSAALLRGSAEPSSRSSQLTPAS